MNSPSSWVLFRYYFLRRLVRLGDEEVSLVDLDEVVGFSGSSGAGGGVVSIVQPIHPEITRTSKTNSRTGMPMAHCCHPVFCSPGMKGEKNAARYTIAIISERMKIAKP